MAEVHLHLLKVGFDVMSASVFALESRKRSFLPFALDVKSLQLPSAW